MDSLAAAPGQAAGEAFETGVRAAIVAALAALGTLRWAGLLTPFEAGFGLFMLPVYYVVVCCLLSVWLGYHEDALARVLAAASVDR